MCIPSSARTRRPLDSLDSLPSPSTRRTTSRIHSTTVRSRTRHFRTGAIYRTDSSDRAERRVCDRLLRLCQSRRRFKLASRVWQRQRRRGRGGISSWAGAVSGEGLRWRCCLRWGLWRLVGWFRRTLDYGNRHFFASSFSLAYPRNVPVDPRRSLPSSPVCSDAGAAEHTPEFPASGLSSYFRKKTGCSSSLSSLGRAEFFLFSLLLHLSPSSSTFLHPPRLLRLAHRSQTFFVKDASN